MNVITTEEAAERLGVTSGRVRALIRDGRLPARGFGRAYLILEKDLALVAVRKPGRPRQKVRGAKGAQRGQGQQVDRSRKTK